MKIGKNNTICSCNWDEMFVKYKKEYDEFEPILR